MDKYWHSSHAVYLAGYHILWCPKFKDKVLTPKRQKRLKEILEALCSRTGYKIEALEVMPEHIHLFVYAPVTVAPNDIVRTLKSLSALEMFKAFLELKRFYQCFGALWARGDICFLLKQSVERQWRNTLKNRRKKNKDKTLRDKFRSQTPRHVLTLEADMDEDQKRHCFRVAEELRQISNFMTGVAHKRLGQCTRRRDYRLALEALRETRGKKDKESLDRYKEASKTLDRIRKEEKLTLQDLIEAARPLRIHLGLNSVLALKCAENIWSGVEKVLFGDGTRLHFRKRFDLPVVQAKQIERTITVKAGEDGLVLNSAWTGAFGLKVKEGDLFAQEELGRIMRFLKDPSLEAEALKLFEETGKTTDTFRVCYVGLKCQRIRGRLRVFVQLTIEGEPCPKKSKDGSPRHSFGTGRVGVDLGTQSVAVCTEQAVFLKNLAERSVKTSLKNEAKIASIQEQMDRSLRAMNPDNYNEDGTVKKGKKEWKYSKHYNRLRDRLKELQRRNAQSRHLAIREMVNTIRRLGDELYIENFSAKGLKKKAPFDPEHPDKKRRRFGRSIQSRCPGYFFSHIKEVFETTGGRVTVVEPMFRASQYDHKADSYKKKELSERWHRFNDGTSVQRDLYSSFLLMNSREDGSTPDRELCLENYPWFEEQYAIEIERIKRSGHRVLNSGI